MQLEKRIEALEAQAGADGRIRVLCLRKGETTEQAFARVRPNGASVIGTVLVHQAHADPERMAKLEAGMATAEMTAEELLMLRVALASH